MKKIVGLFTVLKRISIFFKIFFKIEDEMISCKQTLKESVTCRTLNTQYTKRRFTGRNKMIAEGLRETEKNEEQVIGKYMG